jgi:poly-gamma-glutamate capsule biosynthesis protein CapA/YwtB (metallophosphatase superfamily)
MRHDPITEEQREARRQRRRRRAQRRRRGALTAVGALAVLAFAMGIWSASGEEPASAGTAAEAPRAVSPRAVTRRTAVPPVHSRLGSGKPVTLAFGGDVHFESPIREKLAASPASVLAPIARVLSRADVAMVNLETAVTDGGAPAPKEYVFRAPASAFDALKSGGVDLATVANNHGMDFGKTGLRDTLKAARARGVPVVGAGWNDRQAYAPRRVTVNGQRIAMIGATQVLDDHLITAWTAGPGKMGLASAKDEPRLVRAVREARKTSDTVVVNLHWGVELSSCPTSLQTSLADRLVAAGADVVVGSHAHVLLGAGIKRKALVSYGLGNFVFYASRESTVQSGVLEVTVTGRRIDRYRWVPARISGGVPRPLSGASRAQAVSSWRSLRSCTDLRP